MKISEISTKDVQVVDAKTTLDIIAKKMRDNDCGCILVNNDEEKLIGVVTDRDISVRCVAESLDPLVTTADQVMTPNVLYCFEDEEVTHIASNMAKNKIRRLPVMDQDKKLVGIVSLGDLAIANDPAAGQALEIIREAS